MATGGLCGQPSAAATVASRRKMTVNPLAGSDPQACAATAETFGVGVSVNSGVNEGVSGTGVGGTSVSLAGGSVGSGINVALAKSTVGPNSGVAVAKGLGVSVGTSVAVT